MGHKVLCWMLFGLIGSGLFAADESLDSGMAAIAPIQGIHAYPVSEVCEAILTSAEFIEVSQRPVAVRQAKACELLVRGYHASGYGDAHAEVSPTGSISLTEGPVYRAGELRIIGASPSLEAAIRKELSPTVAEEPAFAQPVKTPTVAIETAKASDTKQSNWKPGERVSFDSKAIKAWKASVTRACDLDGHPGSEFQVDLKKEPESQQVHLQVEMTREAPALVISDFQFDGLQQHTAEEMIQVLKLKPGPCSMLDRQRIDKELYESGRFFSQHVEIIRPFREGDPSQLLIRVKEASGVPSLAQPLRPEQITLLKFRHWMENLADQEYQLHLEDDLLAPGIFMGGLPGNSWNYSLILTPDSDFLLQLKRTVMSDAQGQGVLLRISPNCIAIGSHRSRRVLQIHPKSKTRPMVMVELKIKEEIFGEPKTELKAGAGVNSNGQKKPLLQVRFQPVALLRSRQDDDISYRTENNQLLINSEVTKSQMRIDEESGRLLELVIHDEEGTARQARVWSEDVNAEGVWNQWIQEHHFEVVDAGDAPVTRFVEFLFAEWDAADPARAATRSGILKLIRPELLPGLDRGDLGLETLFGSGFTIPTQNVGLSSTICSLALRLQRNLLRSDSAAASLARTFTVTVASPTPVRLQGLLQQATETDCGPLTCAVFGLGGRLSIPITGLYFSKLGMTRLNAEAFENDLSQWIDAEHTLGRSLIAVIRRLRELTPEETQGLVSLYGDEKTRPHLAEMIAVLQRQSDLPSDELELDRFRALVMRFWDPLIRPGLEELFQWCADPQPRLSPQAGTANQAVRPTETPR